MAPQTAYDGAAGTATLTPLERLLAAALHGHATSAARNGRTTCPLSNARCVIHALARYLSRNCAPVEMTDAYASGLAASTLKGLAWPRFTELEKHGIGPHEALHLVLEDIAAKGAAHVG